MKACEHDSFEINATVNKIVNDDDSLAGIRVDLQVKCEFCDESLVWPRSLPIGLMHDGITRDVEGKELRIPALPESMQALEDLIK